MVWRYSMRPLPQIAFLPGVSPRTERPAASPARVTAVDVDLLAADDDFRFGIDLFNHGFAWEAHEAWEPLWLAAPRDRSERELLRGLIHAAAAVVKAKTGRNDLARRFVDRACEHLAHGATTLLDAPALIAALRAWADDPAQPPPTIALAAPRAGIS